MFRALAALLRRDPDLSDHLPRAKVRDVLERLEALEGQQLRRETEWAETRDQISRHLSRIAAIQQRAQQREADDPRGALSGADPKVLAAILRSKFPHVGG